MLVLLQWNINGYYNNYIDLEMLIKTYNPSIILLNETHLPYKSVPRAPKAYICYCHNLLQNTTSKQGVAILIKKNIPHKCHPLPSLISSLSSEILSPNKITIICAYAPPDQHFTANDFNNLFPTSTHPFILAGDFNAWSPFWGSNCANGRGRIIEDSVLCSNLTVLNDGSPTHFSTHKTFTHIDLTLCSNTLSTSSTWNLIDDLHSSDHFPIVTKIQLNTSRTLFRPRIKYITDSGNWLEFRNACEIGNRSRPVSNNVNQETSHIHKIIRSAANLAIPQTSSKPTKPAPLWWSDHLSTLRQEKQKAWRDYKRSRSSLTLIQYKRANAIFRRKAKIAKADCFRKFTNSINSSSNTKKIWADIKRLTGSPPSPTISALDSPRGTLLFPQEIAQEFAIHFSSTSSDASFQPDFTAAKQLQLSSGRSLRLPLSKAVEYLEADITYLEFSSALSLVKGKTPGRDRISYPMIKQLPPCMISRLLQLYNRIFAVGIYPQVWKTSSVTPILKAGKPPLDICSYRPISLLPCLGKLLEKIIAARFSWYANTSRI